MKEREALKMALKALKELVEKFDSEQFTSICELDEAKEAIEAAEETLAQPEQEPVAVYVGETWCGSVVRLYEDLPLEMPLYTTPPQRTWVGLDWNEMPEIYMNDKAFEHGAQWAEAKLKEKNT